VSEPKRYAWKVNEENDFALVEHPQGEYVDYADYARLKAEVERMTAKQTDIDRVQAQSDFYRSKLMNETEYTVNVQLIDQVKHLEAQIERLTKTGDDMAVWITIIGNSLTCWQIEEWLRAKKGLPSEKEQREKQIKAAAKDGKDIQ